MFVFSCVLVCVCDVYYINVKYVQLLLLLNSRFRPKAVANECDRACCPFAMKAHCKDVRRRVCAAQHNATSVGLEWKALAGMRKNPIKNFKLNGQIKELTERKASLKRDFRIEKRFSFVSSCIHSLSSPHKNLNT